MGTSGRWFYSKINMNEKAIRKYYRKTFNQDRRDSIDKIYDRFSEFSKIWSKELIDTHYLYLDKIRVPFPIYVYKNKTKNTHNNIWLLAGVHGEEPAGPVALSKSISLFEKLAKNGFSLVIVPLINPTGYFRNYRYLFDSRDWKKGKSMGDTESFLAGINGKPRLSKPSSLQGKKFLNYIINLSKEYPPDIVLDFHEDELRTLGGDPIYHGDLEDKNVYVYLHSALNRDCPVAKKIIAILKNNNIGIKLRGEAGTRFKEKIINGIVSNVKDSSLDELLSAKKIFLNKKLVPGPSAKSVVVIETPTSISIGKRIKIHKEILNKILEE